MYLLLKGKLLDSLPPSSRKGAEARNMMSASGKLQVPRASHLTPHTSHLTPHTSHLTLYSPAAKCRHVELARALAVGGGRHQGRLRRVLVCARLAAGAPSFIALAPRLCCPPHAQQLESAPLAVNMSMLCRSLATSPAGAFTGQDPSGQTLFPYHSSSVTSRPLPPQRLCVSRCAWPSVP
jgi:hypothetical protein